MRAIVTGGAGFIGSHVAARLLERGHEVFAIDNLSSGFKKNVPRGATFLELDLARPESVDALPTDIDVVCHLAAQSAGAVSAERPYYDLQVNAGSTLLLSRWCLKHSVQRFLYASSMVAYGDAGSPVKEDAPCAPSSYYGASKLSSEHMLRIASREGLRVAVFRMFTAYGPGQDLANLKQGMVSIYMAYMLRNVPVPVLGSLERFRDILYIDDIVDAWVATAERLETPYQIYNLASGRPTRVRELLAMLKVALDLPAGYPVEEKPGSPSDQFGVYADISKIRQDLGFEPKVALSDGLKRMATWARAQPPIQ